MTFNSLNIDSALLSGINTWFATIASSYSQYPLSVKVCVVSFPSTSNVIVNFSPILGFTPNNLSTFVSVAASFVPSLGNLPSTGSQYMKWAWFLSEYPTSTWLLLKGTFEGIPTKRLSPYCFINGSSFIFSNCSSVIYLKVAWLQPPHWRKFDSCIPSFIENAIVNIDVNSNVVNAIAKTAIKFLVFPALNCLILRLRIHFLFLTFITATP